MPGPLLDQTCEACDTTGGEETPDSALVPSDCFSVAESPEFSALPFLLGVEVDIAAVLSAAAEPFKHWSIPAPSDSVLLLGGPGVGAELLTLMLLLLIFQGE